MKIKALTQQIHDNAVKKGFYKRRTSKVDRINTRLMLIVGELAEAQEELRAGHAPTETYLKDGKPEGFPIELADALIRLLDLAGWLGIDLDKAVKIKTRFNTTRPYKHGGKKF